MTSVLALFNNEYNNNKPIFTNITINLPITSNVGCIMASKFVATQFIGIVEMAIEHVTRIF